jgi:MOSC domain-containing protein YiiM
MELTMTDIELLSIQTGKVQTHILPDGEVWTTGYVKTPRTGAVYVGKRNLEGDEQHHKKFHGGEFRPVLGYSAAHYALWQQEYGRDLPYGSFGENLTLDGLDETNVCLGDVFQIGDTVRVQVSQPRRPCDQIYMHLQIQGIRQRVDATRRTGWYMRVLAEGYIEAGMPVTRLEQPHPAWTIRWLHDVTDKPSAFRADLPALTQYEALTPNWRNRWMKHIPT